MKEEADNQGFEVSRDSDANLSVDEDDRDLGRLGMSAHRCSMIKKYSIETYFLGPSPRKPRIEQTQQSQQPLRDSSEVVLMKVQSDVQEETKFDELNYSVVSSQRPTLGLIVKKDSEVESMFQASPDQEEETTELV